jgi:hypothetical protein
VHVSVATCMHVPNARKFAHIFSLVAIASYTLVLIWTVVVGMVGILISS